MAKKKKKASKPRKAAKKPAKKNKKKSPAVAKQVKTHSLLSEALKDIEAELERLRLEKISTERGLQSVAGTISSTQDQQVELKNKVTKLVAKEEELSLKRNRLKEQIDKVKDKITKVTQLEAEMEEID
ncbi:MAG: hypothetical protein V1494_01650 [Candidatus Diapherotrites archaeon]